MSDGAGDAVDGPTDAPTPASRRRWEARNLVLVVGVGLVLVGIVVTGSAPGLAFIGVPTFGWAAYVGSTAPLTSAPAFWEEQVVQGAALAVLGFVVIAANLGYRAGLRRAARPR